MQIRQLPIGPLEANCYIVEQQGEAVIIDPGFNDEYLENWARENTQKVKYILLTHCHCDHICGAEKLREITNAPICIGEFDSQGYNNDSLNLSLMMGGAYPSMSAFSPPDVLIKSGDTLPFGTDEILCLHTPGHTLGGLCYVLNDTIFTGDTLFMDSIGRTDFYGGSFSELQNSLKKLINFADDKDYTVYSGHGPATTIFREKRQNPYMVML